MSDEGSPEQRSSVKEQTSRRNSKRTRELLRPLDFDISCPECGQQFRPPAKEYLRAQRRGYKSYCSEKCSRTKRGNETQFDRVAPADAPQWYPRYCLDLFQTARKGAAARGIPFYLTKDEFQLVLARAAGRCEITGLSFEGAPERPAHVKRAYLPSLDRIDPNGPYSLANVRLILSSLNSMLGDFGPEPLYRIAAHLPPLHLIAWPQHSYLRAPKALRHYAAAMPNARDEADVFELFAEGLKQNELSQVPHSAPARDGATIPEIVMLEARVRVAEEERNRLLTELEQILGFGAEAVEKSDYLRELKALGAVRAILRKNNA